jgi:quinol monooxygenase YgiN
VKSNDIKKFSDAQISLAVIIEAQEGKEDELRKALIALIEPTRKEKGCINFVLHTDPANKGRFMFYENWENKELWNAHLNSPHITAFGNAAGNLVANTLDLTNWKIYE